MKIWRGGGEVHNEPTAVAYALWASCLPVELQEYLWRVIGSRVCAPLLRCLGSAVRQGALHGAPPIAPQGGKRTSELFHAKLTRKININPGERALSFLLFFPLSFPLLFYLLFYF